MVSVKLWVTVPAALVAVTERSNMPATVGVPARVAVPLLLSTNVTPAGRVPVSSRAGAGVPVAVTGNENAVPKATVSDPALVMAGACSMVSVKLWVTVPTVLVAVMMNVEVPRVPSACPRGWRCRWRWRRRSPRGEGAGLGERRRRVAGGGHLEGERGADLGGVRAGAGDGRGLVDGEGEALGAPCPRCWWR